MRVNAILPGLMKNPLVERVTGFAKAYAAVHTEEMWRARDRQVPPPAPLGCLGCRLGQRRDPIFSHVLYH